jgi:hypothetical protein
MRLYSGQVLEILSIAGLQSARLTCPAQAIPKPGQFVLAKDQEAILPVPLFLYELSSNGFTAAPTVPANWIPGTSISLYGPHGNGFNIPNNLGNLCFISLNTTVARLLPLINMAISQHTNVALFTDNPLPAIPNDLEVFPLSMPVDYSTWADYIALDLNIEGIPLLRSVLGSREQLRCPGQALILTDMPCGGLGNCGICAVQTRTKKYKLACSDGPVFMLNELEW